MRENVKYPQDEEQNEYRYIHFAWLDEIAMGLTAGDGENAYSAGCDAGEIVCDVKRFE